jgi:hypothetical protein
VEQQPFDGKVLTLQQTPNLEAPYFDLEFALSKSYNDDGDDDQRPKPLRCMTPGQLRYNDSRCTSSSSSSSSGSAGVFQYMSLDDLLPNLKGFSKKFNADDDFRRKLRAAIRQDVFDTTPFYANLSEKAASILLLPDSSLEGSWNIDPNQYNTDNIRMKHTTKVLQEAFSQDATGFEGGDAQFPTGDDLFRSVGRLCGGTPSTHFIDIYGVQDRPINHSWHLDAGCSPGKCRTVLWGFPPESNYEGCGVFSHIVPLAKECLAPEGHNRMEPVLFDGNIPEEYIVRPVYEPGKELLLYRDIDVLHSAPDVTYRTSIMRFM